MKTLLAGPGLRATRLFLQAELVTDGFPDLSQVE
jgi:hypothetical protein